MYELFPSPHSGILFLSICACTIIIAGCKVSVPSFGDSFFILPVLTLHGGDRRRVSVPSFGDSFFMKLYAVCLVVTLSCFRPLIRGFFFYCHCILLVRLGKRLRFRPLIRGFFFYPVLIRLIGCFIRRFRPLIRGFFFYRRVQRRDVF